MPIAPTTSASVSNSTRPSNTSRAVAGWPIDRRLGGQARRSRALTMGRRWGTARASVRPASTTASGTLCGPLSSRTDESNRSKSNIAVMPAALR